MLDYPADGGNPRDREAGARWIGRTGLAVEPDDVLVCSGSQHGITTVLATLLAPGDLLVTEELTYPGLKAVASLLHLRTQGLPMDAHGLRPDAFEDACRKGGVRALYVVPTIHNPTGTVMPEARRREIAAIARAHGVAIVEDDIHALLPAERPLPIAAFAPELSYYLMSTSKTLVAGLRVGYVAAPRGTVLAPGREPARHGLGRAAAHGGPGLDLDRGRHGGRLLARSTARRRRPRQARARERLLRPALRRPPRELLPLGAPARALAQRHLHGRGPRPRPRRHPAPRRSWWDVGPCPTRCGCAWGPPATRPSWTAVSRPPRPLAGGREGAGAVV